MLDLTTTPLDQVPTPGGPGQYVKLPIPIQAVQVAEPFCVRTLEGCISGQAGDWLAVGIRGERYPIAAAIFAQTYRPAATSTPGGGNDNGTDAGAAGVVD